jgi:saccharopine dehydrogenase (NADP+, L-glutamate forming)
MGHDASLKDIEPIEWLGMLDGSEKIRLKLGSPAQILQDLLERKWMLKPQDLDLVLMQHLFEYILDGKRYKITSSLVVKGIDQTYTAMANTVGLPAAIGVKLLLTDKIKSTGVIIPVSEEIYEPVLKELISHNIVFQETVTEL